MSPPTGGFPVRQSPGPGLRGVGSRPLPEPDARARAVGDGGLAALPPGAAAETTPGTYVPGASRLPLPGLSRWRDAAPGPKSPTLRPPGAPGPAGAARGAQDSVAGGSGRCARHADPRAPRAPSHAPGGRGPLFACDSGLFANPRAEGAVVSAVRAPLSGLRTRRPGEVAGVRRESWPQRGPEAAVRARSPGVLLLYLLRARP